MVSIATRSGGAERILWCVWPRCWPLGSCDMSRDLLQLRIIIVVKMCKKKHCSYLIECTVHHKKKSTMSFSWHIYTCTCTYMYNSTEYMYVLNFLPLVLPVEWTRWSVSASKSRSKRAGAYPHPLPPPHSHPLPPSVDWRRIPPLTPLALL